MRHPERAATLRVSVVYCPAGAMWAKDLELAPGTTVQGAIEASGVLGAHPELVREQLTVGVFSRPRALDAPLHEGDRVEIYRPLLVEPKEARRHRAELRRKRKGETTK